MEHNPVFLSMEDQMNFMQLTAQRVKESETQLPAVLRQVSARMRVRLLWVLLGEH